MASPQITIIVARSRNGVIGKEGKLPWKLPEDLKFFKEKTQGKPVVMGRKTWESIGRPLPGRQNIVVSRNKNYEAPGAVVVGSLEEAIKACTFQKEVMVIGGANLYAQALPVAENAWVTLIDSDYEGDSFFLNLSPEEWRLVWEEVHEAKDDGLTYRFQRFERIRHT